jgi:ribA/ribD-fused uncharacterized protein
MPKQITAFQGPHRFLSNFWMQDAAPVDYEGIQWPTVEHAFQAAKSGRSEQFLRECATPGQAKRLARLLPCRSDWNDIKLAVMLCLLRSKFSNPTLAAQLVATGDAELIEGNTWGDRFWGQCPLGQGENWLGRLLMLVRHELREGLSWADLPNQP